MSAGSFDGPLQKLNRAKEHLNALEADLNAQGGPYRITLEPDAERGYWLIKAKRVREMQQWPLMLGDCLHNLRAALDHMIWQLVLANGNAPGKWNEFPIAIDPGWFERKINRYLAGVHNDAVAIIRSLQPFGVGEERKRPFHPLWLLNELENVDKHRLVHVLPLAPSGSVLNFGGPASLQREHVETFKLSGGVVEDGTKIARIRCDQQPYVNVDSHITLEVFIEATTTTPQVLWSVNGQMVQAVEDAMHALAPFIAWAPSGA